MKWRYCKDIIAETDRLEAFGDIVYATFSTVEATVHSILYAYVDVSFKYPVLDAINVQPPAKRNIGDSVAEEVAPEWANPVYLEHKSGKVEQDVNIRKAQQLPVPRTLR